MIFKYNHKLIGYNSWNKIELKRKWNFYSNWNNRIKYKFQKL